MSITHTEHSFNEWMVNREVLIFLIYLFYFILFFYFLAVPWGMWYWFPNQTLNPHLLQWIHWVLTTGLPGCPHRKALKCWVSIWGLGALLSDMLVWSRPRLRMSLSHSGNRVRTSIPIRPPCMGHRIKEQLFPSQPHPFWFQCVTERTVLFAVGH